MYAQSGQARLAYEITGREGGAELLLIHAGVNDRRSWRHVIERLGPSRRCVSYDMRGYGETEYESEEGWSPVADALAVMDAAGLRRPVLIACSMGGQAALDLTLAHPDRVGGLVLIGSAIRGAPYPELQTGPTAELNRLIEAAESDEDLEELGRLDAWMWLDGPSAPEGRVSGPARELFVEMNAAALAAPDPGPEADLAPAWPRLGEIAVPTLVMIGRLDAEEIQVVDELAAEIIPAAELRFLEGVAHVPHLEPDESTLAAIEGFLAGLAA